MDRYEKFRELDEMLDKLSDDEKNFALSLLLAWYKRNIEFSQQLETVQDYAIDSLKRRLDRSCDELIEMLWWELWR